MKVATALTLFTAIAAIEANAQCSKDIDCKGDRICIAGECQAPEERSVTAVCGLAGEIPAGISLGFATTEGRTVLDQIGEAAGLENMPRIVTGPVPNASAAIYGKERLIIYSNSFIESMRATAGDWSVSFVFAHELGHHVEGHTVTGEGSNHTAEFQADAFATRTLKRMGASRAETTRAMEAMPMPESGTHPSSASRVARIRGVFDETEVDRVAERSEKPRDGRAGAPPFPQQRQQIGLPPGTITRPCGCYGFVRAGAAGANPFCQSGVEVVAACGGWCVGGGQSWTAVCR